MTQKLLLNFLCSVLLFASSALISPAQQPMYESVEGLVMAGYQGWFNAEGDGAGLGWKHYEKEHEFRPGWCTIDLWPEVEEYQKLYKTDFRYNDGSPAYVFSSRDLSTTMLHFKWMKEYGIDGVYMQRFVASLRTEDRKQNYNLILRNAADASEEYGRAFCVMYDLSGIKSEETTLLMKDWKNLSGNMRITSRKTYLHHNGKPLVAVWGAGFNDNRKYSLDDVRRVVEFLKGQGCSVLLGVPTHWRSLNMDTLPDPKLHDIIELADIVHPWFVGRYNYESYDNFKTLISEDLEWCKSHGKTYMPVVFPGFSWYNLKGGVAAPLNSIPRLGGQFMWKQVANAVELGAKCLYIAMFDEIDEGTAIFKCSNRVPVGESPFLTYEGCEPDRYLWLAGMAGKVLRKEIDLSEEMPERKMPVDYVNPYMGNISHLLVPTYPTVHLPNGMMRIYPERTDYTSDLMKGLPLIVTSHRGSSAFNLSFGQGECQRPEPVSMYRYDNESIKPYLYSVYFEEEEVSARYVPSYHSGMYELTFEDSHNAPYIVLNSPSGKMEYVDGAVSGYQNLENGVNVYIHTEFSETPESVEKFQKGDGEYTVLRFNEGTGRLCIRYGVSFISTQKAAENLAEEIVDYDLESAAAKARNVWNDCLGRIEINGSDENAKTVFYTSLYRFYERMVCISEGDEYFSAFDKRVHKDRVPFYTDDWVWDTYHAAHPLRILINPDKETDMLNSYIRMAEQLPEHWMPTFPEVTGDSRRMNCNHSVAIMLDAYRKGLNDFDIKKAYKYSKAGITEKTLAPWSGCKRGPLSDFYWRNGYIPALGKDEAETYDEVNPNEKRQPVAVTLGTSFDEWCLYGLAQELGFKKDARQFREGSFNYRKLFNSKTLFFHPKDSDGNFIEPFNYERSGGMGARDAYDENNGWVYRWYIQHNIADLVKLYGGNDVFVKELDRTFSTPISGSKFSFYAQLPDHSGNVGQFSMANEPSMHIPYLYCYAGYPWKTQKRIRNLITEWFRNDLMGLPGDEDGGGMSSFVVFSMLGFYPVTPGLPLYVIGSPWFKEAAVRLGNGKSLTIKCENYSPTNKYIQSARLNGKELDRCWFTHKEIINGAVLEFEMGDKPNKEWSKNNVPPSFEIQR